MTTITTSATVTVTGAVDLNARNLTVDSTNAGGARRGRRSLSTRPSTAPAP
ncbi:MAG: hypothetical protein IPP68_12450 [Elusimicrobia bacterium]|nr:hypothetical protein [Elusimicrobiota bacterium]